MSPTGAESGLANMALQLRPHSPASRLVPRVPALGRPLAMLPAFAGVADQDGASGSVSLVSLVVSLGPKRGDYTWGRFSVSMWASRTN